MPRVDAPGLPGIEASAVFVAEPGKAIDVAGQAYTFAALPREAVFGGGTAQVFRSDGTFYRPTTGVDVGKAIDRAELSTTYFATVLHVRKPMSLRMRLTGARGFLAGVELEPEQPLELDAGFTPTSSASMSADSPRSAGSRSRPSPSSPSRWARRGPLGSTPSVFAVNCCKKPSRPSPTAASGCGPAGSSTPWPKPTTLEAACAIFRLRIFCVLESAL